VPYVQFGFVQPKALTGSATGEIVGTAVLARTYVGGQGGVTLPNAGVAGASIAGPVSQPWVALSDLGSNDQMVYLARGGTDGRFDITHVPAGDYQLTLWDGPQETILDSFNVTVPSGQRVDVGTKPLVGWFAEVKGSVFIDRNANGKRDPGEVGVPQFPVVLKERDNSLMDQGTNLVTTDVNGNYDIKEGYPLAKWLVLEAFNTRYKTTGITYQADNQPGPTTLLGAAVDVNVLPIIGLSGTVDWGVQTYQGAETGGNRRYGHLRHHPQRARPAYSVTEDYQPGIPNVTVHLYAVARDDNGDPIRNPDGSLQRGPELKRRLHVRDLAARARLHRPAFQRPAARRPVGPARLRPRRQPAVRGVADDGLPGGAQRHHAGQLRADRERQLRVRRLQPQPLSAG